MTNFKEYTWSEVRDVVTHADKELGQIIDAWNPGKEYTFIELTYPFGSHILDINKSGFQIPTANGQTVPLSDPSVSSALQNKLSYSSLPLGVLTKGGGVE